MEGDIEKEKKRTRKEGMWGNKSAGQVGGEDSYNNDSSISAPPNFNDNMGPDL